MKVGMRSVIAVAAALAVPLADALAQSYPDRPIRVVNPFPAGGSGDAVLRTVFERVGAAIGQPFVYEARTGAAGAIGTDFVAKSAPDGYTLSSAPRAPSAPTRAPRRTCRTTRCAISRRS